MLFIIKTDKANKQADRRTDRTDGQVVDQVLRLFQQNLWIQLLLLLLRQVATCLICCLAERFDIYLHFEGETFFSLAFSLVVFGFLLLCRVAAAANRRQINATACCNLREKIFCCCCCFCCFFILVLQRQQSIDQAIKRSNERAKAAPAMSKSFEPIDGQWWPEAAPAAGRAVAAMAAACIPKWQNS